MKTAKILKWTTLLLVVVGIIFLVIWLRRSREEVPVAKMEPARIVDVRPMVKLCSVEIYEDVPIKAHIGTRHIFAKTALTGSITFDVKKTEQRWEGDTLVVTLPPEVVEIKESTDSGSYRVIDTWNDRLLGSSNFTSAEENEIKRKVVEAWRSAIYNRGYVARARKEAKSNLASMLRPFVPGKEVRVEE
ncbi:MAG: DUF4230 domain-containing protein [Muribaculaceae bacterium]|nr:DUF4230 domain-containing protein [Muribaculaceae bacterium]